MRRFRFLQNIILILSCVVTAVILSCAESAKKPQDVVARIDDFKITYEDFTGQWERTQRGAPLEQAEEAQKRAVLDGMIDEQVTLFEAYRLRYDKEADVVRVAGEKERELAARALRRQEIDDRALTEEVLRRFYQWSDRELELSYMKFFAGNEKETQDRALQKAERIYQRLLNGEDFKALAVAFSEHGNVRKDSGKIGRTDCYQANETFFARAYPLTEGQVTKPFLSDLSVWILKLEKIHPLSLDTYEKERPRIRQRVEERYADKITARRVEFNRAILAEYHFTLLPENIDFFCERTKRMKTLADTTDLFSAEELKKVLAESDVEKTGIGDIFFKSAPYYWRSLYQRRVIDMLLRDLHTNRAIKAKAMKLRINERPEVREEYHNWLTYYLKKTVIQKEVIDKIDVADEILRPFYEQRRHTLIVKKQATVREIFCKTEADINRVYRSAKSGDDFVALHKKYSQLMDDRTEGIIGPFPPGMHGKLGELAFSSRVGEISPPFRYRGGFSIIQVLAHEPERTMTYEEAKESLKNDYIQANWQQRVSVWQQKARKHYRIRISL